MTSSKKYFVKREHVTPYSPANHTGTVNRRLIGPETVGAEQLEVVLGVVEKGKGAVPHSHPGIEQPRCSIAPATVMTDVVCVGDCSELQSGFRDFIELNRSPRMSAGCPLFSLALAVLISVLDKLQTWALPP